MGIDSRTPLPEDITTFITKKSQQLLSRHQLHEFDRQDIEQAITLAVIRKRAAVDERRAEHTGFLICLVEHAIADILAARQAGNRDYRRESGSLDRWVKDDAGDWVRRCDLVTEEDAGLRNGRPDMSRDGLRDLAIDLAEATAQLSPRLRKILDCYAVQGSARKVAKAIGLHPSTVCEAIQQIKAHFDRAGLRAYLPIRSANPTVPPPRR